MSKPGDLVEFTPGLHGLAAPRNLGLVIDRFRKKGVAWIRILTLEGEKEIKAEHLRSRLFKARYDGDARDRPRMESRLQQLVAQHTTGGLAEESEDDLGRLEEELWESTCDDPRPAWTEPEIAAAKYVEPSPMQLRNVRECLDRCRRAGTGRFQNAGKGDLWRPWSRVEVDSMRKAWSDLAALRNRLVAVVEDAEGRRFCRVEITEAKLSEQDSATLAWVKPAMSQFVAWDGVPDGAEPVAGIGGIGAVRVFGMDLHRNLGFLAADWIHSEHTTVSSDYVHFLLETGLWSPQDAVDALVRRHVNQEEFFEHEEDARAESDANRLPEPDILQDPGRADLRYIPCYTIDPPDAKDFDDAVGIEPLADGATRLWVHVADVSHYVSQDSYLDRHAKKRATSVYLPGRVLPMLPHRISDHLCSLRDDGDRFALSVAIDVAADGKQGACVFYKAMIRVTENLSYGEALKRAQAGVEHFAQLLELSQRMRTHRRGLELETGELKVLLGDTGFTALEKRADDATRMIETFMVAANEAVAKHLATEKIPLLFRCHPLPDAQKTERYQHQLATMGIEADLTLPRRPGAQAGPARMESILDRLKSGGGKLSLFGGGVEMKDNEPEPEPEAPVKPLGFSDVPEGERDAWLAPFRTTLRMLLGLGAERSDVARLKLLGCMGRAYYTPDNEGHFGLASTHYCHFTSPIRRYPDLVTHRNLKWHIAGQKGEPPHKQESLRAMCDHCSNQEKAADALERRIKASCLVLASMEAEAPSGSARITGITPTSLFVLRDDGIEARIPARDLPGGPYQVDEWESMLFVEPDSSTIEPHELKSLRQLVDPESGELRIVRARLADGVTVRLAGRDVAAGRTGAELLRWS